MPDSRKTKPAQKTTANQTAAYPWEEFYGDLASHAWQPALRWALSADHAAERCGRRTCKVAGECRVTVCEGEPIDCGGGLSDETLASACNHVLFGCIMVRRFAEDIGLLPPAGPDRHKAAAETGRAVSRRRKTKVGSTT